LFGGHFATHMLVDTELHAAFAGFQLQRHDLAVEAAFGNGAGGAALAGQASSSCISRVMPCWPRRFRR
jgi:hypothetical protein